MTQSKSNQGDPSASETRQITFTLPVDTADILDRMAAVFDQGAEVFTAGLVADLVRDLSDDKAVGDYLALSRYYATQEAAASAAAAADAFDGVQHEWEIYRSPDGCFLEHKQD